MYLTREWKEEKITGSRWPNRLHADPYSLNETTTSEDGKLATHKDPFPSPPLFLSRARQANASSKTTTLSDRVKARRLKLQQFWKWKQQRHVPQGKRLTLVYRLSGVNRSNESLCNGKTLPNSDVGFDSLPQSTVVGVEKFMFFVGYPRSGHSMIGSLLDAHPDMVIAHEHFLFEKCVSMLKKHKNIFEDKVELFNALFTNSFLTSKCGWRSSTNTSKGYNFDFNFKWQGTFNHLRVIGDKSGGSASQWLKTNVGNSCLQNMINSLDIPVIALHVVRNPYDMIATSVLYSINHGPFDKTVLNNSKLDLNLSFHEQLRLTKAVFIRANTVLKLHSYTKQSLKIMEVHIEDYIEDPRSVIEELCHSLGVNCPRDYVEEFTEKAYKNVSRSRDLIKWSPHVLNLLDRQMKKYPFFNGYTFENSFRRRTLS